MIFPDNIKALMNAGRIVITEKGTEVSDDEALHAYMEYKRAAGWTFELCQCGHCKPKMVN